MSTFSWPTVHPADVLAAEEAQLAASFSTMLPDTLANGWFRHWREQVDRFLSVRNDAGDVVLRGLIRSGTPGKLGMPRIVTIVPAGPVRAVAAQIRVLLEYAKIPRQVSGLLSFGGPVVLEGWRVPRFSPPSVRSSPPGPPWVPFLLLVAVLVFAHR